MPIPKGARLPWEPLHRVFDGTAADVAEMAGVSVRQVFRWKHDGIPVGRADRVACKLGYHPVEIWPEWDSVA